MSDTEVKPGVVDAATRSRLEEAEAELKASLVEDLAEEVAARVLARIRVTPTEPSEEHQRVMFAASAMNAIILGEVIVHAVLAKKADELLTMTQTADLAYIQADAMLAARAKRDTQPAPAPEQEDEDIAAEQKPAVLADFRLTRTGEHVLVTRDDFDHEPTAAEIGALAAERLQAKGCHVTMGGDAMTHHPQRVGVASVNEPEDEESVGDAKEATS